MKWYNRNVDMPVFVVFMLIVFVVLCCLVVVLPRTICPDSEPEVYVHLHEVKALLERAGGEA